MSTHNFRPTLIERKPSAYRSMTRLSHPACEWAAEQLLEEDLASMAMSAWFRLSSNEKRGAEFVEIRPSQKPDLNVITPEPGRFHTHVKYRRGIYIESDEMLAYGNDNGLGHGIIGFHIRKNTFLGIISSQSTLNRIANHRLRLVGKG